MSHVASVLVLTWWDDHRASAPHASGRWAVSDRGWLVRDGQADTVGHYLDYGANHNRYTTEKDCRSCLGLPNVTAESAGEYCRKCRPGNVHAVCYAPHSSAYLPTADEAMRWIEKQAGLDVCSVNPASRVDQASGERFDRM